MFCPHCGTENIDTAKFCSKCGKELGIQKEVPQQTTKSTIASEDKLEGYWYAIIWGSLIIPYVGAWIIVILSSIMYYRWKKTLPQKAKKINTQGWLAWLVGNILWGLIYFASRG